MLSTKRQRDRAACGCIVAAPFLAVVIVCSVLFVRWNSPNNPQHPDYISPEQRSRTSVASCEASRSSHFAGMQISALPTTKIFLPLLPSAKYITALEFRGEKSETTIWGVATDGPCIGNIRGLPEPYMTYTIGPTTAMYNFISTKLFAGCYDYPCRTKPSTSLKTTVNVNCSRTVFSAYIYTTSSTTFEERTDSKMTCTSRWRENRVIGPPLEWSSTIYINDGSCGYWEYCSRGRADVTIAGDLAGLTSTVTTADSSSTRTPTPSMVTKTMSQINEATTGTITITAAPPPASMSGTVVR